MKSFLSSLRRIDRTERNLSSSQNSKSIDRYSVITGKRWLQSKILLKIGAIATFTTLGLPSIVRADGIYMTNMKSTLTQSSINLLTDPSRTPGVQSGDIVEYVLEAKVANALGGPGVYFTTYIPSGVEVLGAWFVTDATGATRRDPGLGGQANDGWGARGSKTPFGNPFSTVGNSRQSDLSGDTGIFYSTDTRTQLYTSDSSNIAKGPTGSPAGTGGTSNGYTVEDTFYGVVDAFNLWDANQVNAFGRGGPLNSIPTTNNPGNVSIINFLGQGSTPFGSGSAVAGTNTGYKLDNTGSIGPWNRIQYPGSSIANVSDGIATAIGAANTATLDDASLLGTALSDAVPLSSTTNAVRWSDGLRKLNEVVYVKVRVKINAAAIAATTGTLLNFEANGSDNWGSGSKDNPWRYFGPTVPQSAQLFAAKEVYKVNGVVYTGGVVPAGATITYRVRYLNLSSLPVKGISFQDTLPTSIATTGCTALLPTLGSLSNSVTISSVTAGTSTCPAAASTVTFGNLPNVTLGVIPALRGGEFTYDVKLAPTAANGTVVTNSAKFAGQDIVSSAAVSTTSAPSVTIGVPISVSGTVFSDADANVAIDGSDAGTNAGSVNLTIYAIDTATNKVLSKATVAANGTYTLANVPASATVKLRLSNDATFATGATAPTAPSLPSSWFHTGKNLNGTIDGTIATLGDIALTTTTANLTAQNFGIRQTYVLPTPAVPTVCVANFTTNLNTGINASGGQLADGANDLNWSAEWLTGPTSGTGTPYSLPRPVGIMPAVVTGNLALGAWITEPNNAKWISYPFRLSVNKNGNHNDADLDGALGERIGSGTNTTDAVRLKFTAKLTLPSNASSIAVSLPVGVSVDNRFVSLKINGVENLSPIPIQDPYATDFRSIQSVNIQNGWQPGVNTIEVIVDSGPDRVGFFLAVQATTTQLCPSPNLLLVKRITAINGLNTTTSGGDNLAMYKDESSNIYDDNVLTSPAPIPPDTDKWPVANGFPFMIGGTNGGNVKPKDSIEYTIYFLSTGISDAKNVLVCDRVPANITFSPNAFTNTTANPGGAARGIAVQLGNSLDYRTNSGDNDDAQYFPPGIEPSTVYGTKINCGGINDNGAVVVNLRDRPKATGILADDRAAGAYGFVRFQGVVK